MADIMEALFDITAILVALGLSAYGFKLLKTFSGGIMQAPFRVLATAPLVFVVGEAFDVLNNLGVMTDPEGIFHISFEVLFIIALFVGFYQLSKVWTLKTKTSA